MLFRQTKIVMPDDWTTFSCTLCKKNGAECRCLLCEYCDEKITPQMEGWQEDYYVYPNSDKKANCCCDECANELQDQILIARLEDSREYEIWGYDYDSWYR